MKLDYIKMKNLCSSKDTIKRVRGKLEIFAISIIYKGLMGRIYKNSSNQ